MEEEAIGVVQGWRRRLTLAPGFLSSPVGDGSGSRFAALGADDVEQAEGSEMGSALDAAEGTAMRAAEDMLDDGQGGWSTATRRRPKTQGELVQ